MVSVRDVVRLGSSKEGSGIAVDHLCKVCDVAKGLSNKNANESEFVTVAITQGSIVQS